MNRTPKYEATRHRVSAGRIDLALTLLAGGLIITLTAVAFWLSYAHLHDVAHGNGLGADPARAWAWPGTLDTFVVIGEVLILRASLRGKHDGWAYASTAVGSVGSIVLNVMGVPEHSTKLAYVVAAVPPSAAMLAFGLLMRQVHQIIGDTTAQTDTDDTATDTAPVETDTVADTAVPVEAPADTAPVPAELATVMESPITPELAAALVVELAPYAAPAPVAVPTLPRHLICGPAVHRPRVLASDGALDELLAYRAPVEAAAVPPVSEIPAQIDTAALDAILAAARAARTEAPEADAVSVYEPADTVTDETDTDAVPTDTDDDDTAVPVPAPGGRLTDVELDAVVVMLRTETDPPRSYREMESRFRELGYTGSAARLRASWERVTAEHQAEAEALRASEQLRAEMVG